MTEDRIWRTDAWIQQIGWILDSYHHWVGKPLLDDLPGDPLERAETAFHSPVVIVSHDGAADPLLNYGNAKALELWEAEPSQLIGMPSRLTAEPVHRDERARMLAQTSEKGYSADYQGIRISLNGRRFRIHQATIWNLIDETGNPKGQAASFDTWTFLE